MKKGKIWAGLLIVALMLTLLSTFAMAETDADKVTYVKSDKTEVKVGETITMTYDFSKQNESRTDKFTKVNYRWTGSYPSDSETSRRWITLKEDTVSGVSGKLTYKVEDYDGDRITLYIYALTENGTYMSYTESVDVKVTNAKKLLPPSLTCRPAQGTAIPNQGKIQLNVDITGSTGDYSNLSCWVQLQTDDGETTTYVFLRSDAFDQENGTLDVELRSSNTMDRDVVFTELVVNAYVNDRWYNTTIQSEAIPLTYIDLGQSGWVSRNGGYYYGDRYGHGYRGEITVGEKDYYLDENGRMVTGFFKKVGWSGDLEWSYADESGEIRYDCSGLSSITVPAAVDAWPGEGFYPFISLVDRDFVIYCTPGSFAEKYARQNGLQYDNGVERVVGYTIGDVNAKVNWIIDHYITSSMTERQKALVLHNWLINNAHYDTSYSIYDAYGVLLLGYGVCDSYSKAYELLLNSAGIDNIRVTGSANNGTGYGYESHAWNLANIGGTWYHIDTTWDDPIGGAAGAETISGFEGTSYFMKNDDYMARDHRWSAGVAADGVDEEGDPGWITAGGYWYYYGEDRALVKGLVTIDGITYGFEDTGRLASGWFSSQGIWYATDANGVLLRNGWMPDGDKWYYMGEDGLPVSGLQEIKGSKYFFGPSGIMMTGWQQADGQWYYFLSGGTMAHGWCQADGDWYYMDADGLMVTGLLEIDGGSYFFDASGRMATGWIQVNGAWCYFQKDGTMAHGWCKADGKWYYLEESGAMAIGLKKIKGNQYLFDQNGEMQTGWKQLGSVWYYFLEDGSMASGWQVIDDNWEYFNDDGSWGYTWGPVE